MKGFIEVTVIDESGDRKPQLINVNHIVRVSVGHYGADIHLLAEDQKETLVKANESYAKVEMLIEEVSK